MNKNTLLAIAIMFSTIFLVQSPLFKESALYRWMGGQSPSELTKQATLTAPKKANELPKKEEPTTSLQADSLVTDTLVPLTNDTVVLENDLLKVTFEEKGAAIIGVMLKKYTYGEDHPLANKPVSLLTDSTKSIAGVEVAGVDLRETHFELDTLRSTKDKLVFTTFVEGKPLSKSFVLPKSSYYLNLKVSSPLFETRTETNTKLFFDAGIEETQTANGMSPSQTLRTVTVNNTEKTKRYQPKKITELRKETDTYHWMSLSSKYFTTAVILPQATASTITMANWAIVPTEKIAPKNMDFALVLEQATPKGEGTSYTLFLGPNERAALAESNVGLDKTLYRGYAWFFFANLWFPGLCEFVLWLLKLFFVLAKDYGIAILLLTLLLKVATFPMSNSSMKSMAAMQELKPKLDKLQEKYKNNPQLLQQKTMELYREEGINPLASLAGCLPMLLQFPIMIALFLVLQKAIELRGETTFLLPWVTDLSQNEVLFTVPFSFLGVNYFAILPILSGVLMYFQNKKTMTDPAQRQMMMMMPPMMTVMFYTMPAGLNFYFVLSSLFQIIQQFMVDHAKKKKGASKDVVTVKARKVK